MRRLKVEHLPAWGHRPIKDPLSTVALGTDTQTLRVSKRIWPSRWQPKAGGKVKYTLIGTIITPTDKEAKTRMGIGLFR